MKNNLPVILLKNLVLLPYQEVRLEINNDISKKAIENSKKNYNGEILVVCPLNELETAPDVEDLPKIGVVGVIKSTIKLPNNSLRVIIDGKTRIKVFSYINYFNDEDALECITQKIDTSKEDEVETTAYLRKLKKAVELFINNNASVSNSIMNQIKNIEDLGKLTDLISNFLPLTFEKKISLMLNASAVSRSKMLIKELYVENAINDIDKRLDKELEDSFDKSQKEFLLKEKLSLIKKELGEEKVQDKDIEYFNNVLSNKKLPPYILDKVIKEINRFSLTPETSPEIIVIKNYIDFLLSFPFLEESKEEKNITKIEKKLNENHFGLISAKLRILEYISVKNFSGVSPSPIICLVGPAGVGKTTFASSVAYSLGRKFAKISLGGLNDPSELNGHRRTYVASNPGKIVTSLIKAKANNPVILLDEVDKISRDYKGDPTAILLDILDKKQNNRFVDNYINEEIDLSNVFFILTANDETKIPAALYDRLEIIKINSYTSEEKLHIAKNYLIKNILVENGLSSMKFKISDEALLKIINNYTCESGVRHLERLINKITRKTIKEYPNIKSIDIEQNDIMKLLGNEKFNTKDIIESTSCIHAVGVNAYYGNIIDIETISYIGKEKTIITGAIGKEIKESIDVSFSYIRSNKDIFKLSEDIFNNKTYHINFRNADIFKNGPSAGVSITTSILCYLKNIKIDNKILFTGEISLKGDILRVGSIKEKLIIAKTHNITDFY
ncbi:MAG: S16 family serine protease, partial [Bacilli bacterium]